MMNQFPLHKFFIHNGQIKSNSDFIVSENTGGVYEVIRVANRVPLFVEDHLNRFYSSAKLAGHEIRFSKPDLENFINLLILENRIPEGNILLSCKTNLKAFFITHNYPAKEWYEKGVACGILHAERVNPNAKVFQTSVRQQADTLISQEGYYEVLLVDHKGHITEGSRSNLFFVKGNSLYTPPGKGVLLGITRQKTIQLAHELNYKVLEQDILLNDLQLFDAIFITGTSPKILPVDCVAGYKFDAQNRVVQNLRIGYDQLIEQYIAAHPGN
ncbi:MAG TPA: aminotransferase class IV [Mariniphaga sp.]|nr:aminotransferase class IV [Mariniphaga sp.]